MQICQDHRPSVNSDVSGIGVRISFYLQSVLLSMLAARSASADEITDALSTLIVTNLAMCVTTWSLAFSSQVNLYDGLMVCYLLTASWFAIFFALPQYNRYKKSDKYVKLLAVFQSYFVFGTVLAIFGTARSFGSVPECNQFFSAVFFHPFDAETTGRTAGLVIYSLIVAGYTWMVWNDYKRTTGQGNLFNWRQYKARRKAVRSRGLGQPASGEKAEVPQTPNTVPPPTSDIPRLSILPPSPSSANPPSLATAPSYVDDASSVQSLRAPPAAPQDNSSRRRHPPAAEPDSAGTQRDEHTLPFTNSPHARGHGRSPFVTNYKANVDGRVILNLALIAVASLFAILNTELLRLFNHPTAGGEQWGFGQILPMFLIVLPLQRTVKIFWDQGLAPKKNREATKTKRVRVRRTAENTGRRRAPSTQADAGPSPRTSDYPFFGSNMFDRMGAQPPVPNGGARIEEVSDSEDEDASGIGDDDGREAASPTSPSAADAYQNTLRVPNGREAEQNV